MADHPGLENQSSVRTGFRFTGMMLVAVGAALVVVGVADLFATMNSDSFEGPERFWMAFVGLPLLAVGGWCLQAGYVGAASRYAAGEVVPVVKDSLAHLTATGPHCTQCGVRAESSDRFCSGCGTALA